ncbi:MAG: DNA helicase UvrD [Actinobacteria bacterium HGW-Actinobacteria-6]|nr:MAG: DNA helicase UvrD [Actinobacteria bacterium HGW-Actinobacteria-6]
MTTFLNELNPAQRDAVTTTEGPLLVLAGAGSGKTRVLTYRIAHIIAERRISPSAILAITFTNKASQEMRSRLENLVGPSARSMWVMTFHAFCVRVLRAEGHHLGYSNNFTIYDQDDAKRMLTSAMAELDVDPKRYPPKMIGGRISAAKNDLVLPEALAASAVIPPDKMAAKVYALYQRRLQDANAMDFDDLLVNAWKVLSAHPDVLAFYQDRFRYIHVDEYQDTNHAQYSIVNMLAAKTRNLMVVGDDDQSIYSWRGADIRNILEFEQDYPEAAVIKLEENYRSTKTILAAANAVVENNRGRKPKTLFTANAGGEAITRYFASDERDEARFVAEEVERLLRSEHRTYSDFAIFYRTNAQSRVLEDIFLRVGVPYRLVGGTRFFERAEIRDVMAWLRSAVNPADVQSLRRVMEKRAGIGKTTIELLQAHAYEEGITLSEAIARAEAEEWVGGAARKRVDDLAAALEAARTVEAPTLRDRVEAIVARSGLLTALAAEGSDEARGRGENIHEFFGVVGEYDQTHEDPEERTLESFLEWIALRTDLDQLEDGDHTVTLMTLHTAKGLEFPVVFLVGMEDGIFPHINSMYEPQKLEEERRLCYVGITRARERLYITHANSRQLFGETQSNAPSTFIGEIPEEHLRTEGVGSAGFGSSAPGRGRGDRGGSMRWGTDRVPPAEGRVFGSGAAPVKKTQERLELAPGDVVDHKTFGRGVVKEITGDKVTIAFKGLGTKSLLMGYAPIRKVEG